MPSGGMVCLRCKERKVSCTLSSGRKRGVTVSFRNEVGDGDASKPKKPRVQGLRPSAGPPSVWVPERMSSIVEHLTEVIAGQNRLLDRFSEFAERQTLAMELQAGSIDRLVSIVSRAGGFGSGSVPQDVGVVGSDGEQDDEVEVEKEDKGKGKQKETQKE